MSYLEEIFERAEHMFSDLDQMVRWLDSFENPDRGETLYTEDAIELRDELNRFQIARDDAERVDVIDDDAVEMLEQAWGEVSSIPVEHQETISEIERKLDLARTVRRELKLDVEEQLEDFREKAEVIDEEPDRSSNIIDNPEEISIFSTQEKGFIFRETRNLEERAVAEESLRETAPFSLRAYKGHETRRKKASLQSAFEGGLFG